jgi:hypothetical protein
MKIDSLHLRFTILLLFSLGLLLSIVRLTAKGCNQSYSCGILD